MTFYFGGGIKSDSDPGTAFAEGYKKSKLASLYGQAAKGGDRKSALAAMYEIDPQEARQAQTHFGQLDENDGKQLQELAKVTSAAWRSGNKPLAQSVYSKALELARGRIPGFNAPEQLDDATASVFGQLAGDKAADPFTLSPGSARYGADGKLIVEQPFAPKGFDGVWDSERGMWVPRPGAMPQGGMGQQPPQGQPQPQPQPGQQSAQGGSPYREAIASIESAGSGDYTALGPPTKTGDRAYGRYQVMGANIPEWTKAALGRSMSPQEFMASPQAQDAVFDHRFGGYVQKYGPEGAAKAWFAGEGGMGNAGARDSLGTSVADYAGKFTRNMGGMNEQYQTGASGTMPASNGLRGIRVEGVEPKQRERPAPSGWQWNAAGDSLEPIPGGPADRKINPTPPEQAKVEMAMRKEVEDRVKQDRSVLGMFQNVKNAAKNETAPGDLSMIFAYMKMLDPTSVVREQEFANAQNATGIPDRIRNLYNQAKNGNRLNPSQRTFFIAEAQNIANEAQRRITNVAREYQGMAEQYGYDTQRATGMPDFRNAQGSIGPTVQSQPQRGPAQRSQAGKYRVGQVIQANGKRYRVVGGDLNDPDVEEVR